MTGYNILPLKEEPCSETVYWYGEESLSLGRVNIHSDHLVDPGHLQTHCHHHLHPLLHTHLQHPRYQLGCYRLPLLWLLVISSEGINIY